MDWRDSLRERNLPEVEPSFRHNLSFVGVSTIAKQFYCEAKVEQEYTRGQVPSEAKDVGTDIHEEILAMKHVGRKELIKHILKEPSLITSFPLYGEIGELRVIGMPDAVIFTKSKPEWLIELKTTRGDHTRLWNDQLLQVKIYGLLLEKMGFNCSKLKLVLVRMRQDGALEDEQRTKMLAMIRLALIKDQTAKLEETRPMKFFIHPHDRREVERSVLWAQDYWLQRREPIPTTNEYKCRTCEFKDVCPSSLWKGPETSSIANRGRSPTQGR
ncbi:MAG: PD-(D/E)XK nuclease family protein [Thaumarchaeota archaeon]|nr:PD-(D/E)XK nuclease family protein [Nitrososphaerota archaeon]